MRGDFWRRLRLPWMDREDIEAEVDDEIAFHLEMRARELIESGVPESEAYRRVRSDFGDIERTRRGYVSRRGGGLRRRRLRTWLAELGQDLRFGARGLRRRPGFSATAILVLALGIGAPTTVFTLIETIFFERPEHVLEPHRLARVFRSWAPGGGGGVLQNSHYAYYRENATAFAGLAAYGGAVSTSYRLGAGEPGQLMRLHVSDNYFDVLGVRAALGRTFRPEENRVPGRDPVAVLSHGFWSRALGADPTIVGRELRLNGIPFTVIGIAPEGFTGLSPVQVSPDAWVPVAMYGTLNRIDADDAAWWETHPRFRSRWLDVVGRLAEGVTIEAAEANLVVLHEAIVDPHRDPQEGVMVSRQFLYQPSQEETLTTLSRVLLTVVGIVLLVAAANVAVLLLSRATTRYREIGIRTAIGAGRNRIIRQLVTETVLLGSLGGAVGIALAFFLSEAAASFLPLPFEARFVPDPRVLGAAIGLTVVTSVVVGLAPALHGARHDPRAVIAGRTGSGGRGFGVRDALVVSQVALSLVLVAGAFLFTRSFRAAAGEDLGFDAESVLVTEVNLQNLGYDADRGRLFIDEALDRLAALPSVLAVSTTNRVPFRGDWTTDFPAPEGATPNAPDNTVTVGMNVVGPDYFEVMGIEMVAGRPIDDRDGADAAPAIVVNETLAELMWPGLDPIGRVFPELDRPYTVVGVARDATYYELGEEPWTQAYRSVQQAYEPSVNLVVRTDRDASALATPVQTLLREIDPELAFGDVTTLEAVVDEELARYEVSAVLVSLFGLIALVLAAAGLYGVVAFTVTTRTREIGVRMALGADRARVARSVLAGGLRLSSIGVGLGLLGAFALRGYTRTLLYGIEPTDPLPLVTSCVALLAVTTAACLIPARRATTVDPVEAIRAE